MIKNTWCIYFSPSGTTKKTVNQIAAGIQKEWQECDLLAQREPMPELGPDDLLIAGAPVFAGRIPVRVPHGRVCPVYAHSNWYNWRFSRFFVSFRSA